MEQQRYNQQKYRFLCLSGGGIRTISYIGALEVLEAAGFLTHIQEYLGVSAGALIAFLLCIGFTLPEIKNILFTFDFGEIRSVDPTKLLEYDEHFGIDDGEGLIQLCEKLLALKNLPTTITFAQLANYKNLRIFATDLTTQSVRELSFATTPTVRVIDALRSSMSLPFYFTPTKDPITGHLLTDGGVIANYPIIHLNNFNAQDAIGLTFDDHEPNTGAITSVLDYFGRITSCFWINENKAIYSRYAKNTIIIPCSEYPSWNFEATDEDKQTLFKCGEVAATSWLESGIWKPTVISRRRSVA